MEAPFHSLSDLFAQLGLPNDEASILAFIHAHRPLPADTPLCDAPFWSPSQARFLREDIRADADWSTVVDGLAARLSA